ncbi:hypothetical protein A6A04_00710 [Paramagnetospirillum marisnigri]|uniref:Response regulatory domain-containing protein n=1 Tax=Paramagnetospirillum marisnigri TaxID=1285242 RepID=A0A178MRW7_9PROT|nr:fused response regulator/phosphatase [Paramagnetospirillum marisnigri]OAN52249.1 hypothetical protein A6A04_00710 [Paramagnetospirillum marisnigri]
MTRDSTDFSTCCALLVEDSIINQQLIRAMLDAMGIGRVEVATNGLEGLDMAASLRPDIIILDIMMPKLDGFGFLERFRADPANDDTPVIVTTALGEQPERVRAFDLGAADYVVKPIDRREFTARVSVHLRSRLLVGRLSRYRDRLGRDLSAARDMQLALLPGPERVKAVEAAYGVRLASVFRSSDELGGDLWDVIALGPQAFAVYLVDFTGHGVAAAINTFRLHVMMARKQDLLTDPAALLERVNQTLLGVLRRGQFAAMVHAVFHMERGVVEVAMAAAPGPIHRDPTGLVRLISESSHPLGLVPEARYRSLELPFAPGHGLLLHSDGLIEAADADGNLFGDEGARRLAAGYSGDLEAEIEALMRAGWRFDDDLSMVWVERVGDPPP